MTDPYGPQSEGLIRATLMRRGPQAGGPRQSSRRLDRRVVLLGSSIVNITEDVRKYATEQAISEEEALKRGMQEKSKEFVEKGVEVYAKA